MSVELGLLKEHWLKVFENELLKEIFVPKIEKAGGAWRKLHNRALINSVVDEPEGGHLKRWDNSIKMDHN